MKGLFAGLRALGPARLAALAVAALATLGLLAMLSWRAGGTGPMALLYGDLDLRDAAQMTDLLDKAKIAHELGAGGTSILVPTGLVAQARLDLAQNGLPSGGSIGYEIFDRGDGLTANQFQQSINQTRAMEGELGRSIRMIRGVRNVRVHLVLAKREPFAREQQEAQASVLLTMSGAARMDREGVQAVLNLVAAAVPGLKTQNIAIVDDRGALLARAGQPSEGAAAAATTEELRHATETRLSQAVETLLERSLGAGHVRAEASVDMDFDQSRETDEKYDPEGQVTRSTQTVTDNSKSTEKTETVSVQNNLPNPDNGTGGSGTQDQRQEETTNYEIGKTVRTIIHDQPRIHRISLAVMVDQVAGKDATGKTVWQDRGADELGRIAGLVRSVVGYDEKRGDIVQVASMKFADDDAVPPPALSGLQALGFGKGDIMRLAESLLFGVVALLVLFTVLRPMMLRLTTLTIAPDGAGTGKLNYAPAHPGSHNQNLLGGPAPALLEDGSMVNLGNVEGQIRASSIRKIAELVERHPAESVAIMRGWMAQE